MKGQRAYWPVYWSGNEDGPEGLAYFSDEAMARHIAGLFEMLGLHASVHPPVHLGIYDTFLFSST